MKYFNIMGDSLKNPILRTRGSRKSNIQGELLKKGEAGQFSDLREGGAWQKRGGGGGGVVVTLMHTMNLPNY